MQYRYSGPLTALTLNTETGPRDVVLHPNASVDLPEGNAHVTALVAQGFLSPEETPRPRASDAQGTSGRKPVKEETADGR